MESYLNPEILARIQGLALRARLIVEGYVSGVHRSPFHGFSIEFAEHREYSPGDDLRYVDWKVFGRTDKFYLKQYEEETNLVCNLLLDTSESMSYRGPDAALSKLEYAKCVAAALSYLVLHQQDSIGLTTFDQEIRALARASSNPSQLKQVLHLLDESAGERKTETGPIFHSLAERFRKRGIVIVLSDLFDDVPSMLAGLKHFRHRRHEVILFHILDPAELDFPFRRMTMFEGLEGAPRVIADPPALRKAYLKEFQGYIRQLRQGCRMHRIDYVQMRTDESFDLALSTYLASRSGRLRT
ncbi:MAG: DUF58 domain-containing protein [Thermoguttaceae bacterium]